MSAPAQKPRPAPVRITARTAASALAAVILVQVIAGMADVNLDLFGIAQLLLLSGPGPLAVFTGRWMLVDV